MSNNNEALDSESRMSPTHEVIYILKKATHKISQITIVMLQYCQCKIFQPIFNYITYAFSLPYIVSMHISPLFST